MATPYRDPRPRRFAPLNPQHPNPHSSLALHGIIFDVDGTLCLPQNHMFREMRSALSIPKTVDILDHIRSLSDAPDVESTGFPSSSSKTPSSPRARAVAVIQNIERTAMTAQTPQPGLLRLMDYLDSRSVRKALCTRNFPAPVQHLLTTYLPAHTFEPVITRDTEGVAPKPSPEGIWLIARTWGLDVPDAGALPPSDSPDALDNYNSTQSALPSDALGLARQHLGSRLIMVGDSIDDLAAGYRAGAATVLLVNEDNEHLREHEYLDLAVRRLDELVEILEGALRGGVDCTAFGRGRVW